MFSRVGRQPFLLPESLTTKQRKNRTLTQVCSVNINLKQVQPERLVIVMVIIPPNQRGTRLQLNRGKRLREVPAIQKVAPTMISSTTESIIQNTTKGVVLKGRSVFLLDNKQLLIIIIRFC